MRRQMDGQSYSAEYEQRQRDPGRGMALAESATLGTVATPIRARGLLKRTYDRFANESLTPQSLRWRQIAADAAALALGAFVAFGLQMIVRPVSNYGLATQILLLVAAAPGFALGGAFNELHRARANERPVDEAMNVLKAVSTGIAAMLLLALVVQYKDISRLWVFLTAASMTTTTLIERRISRSVFARLRAEGRLTRRIVIVGTDEHATNLERRYRRNPSIGYHVVGFVDAGGPTSQSGPAVLGEAAELSAILEQHDACGVVISVASVPEQQVNILTRRLTDRGFHVALSSSLSDIDISRLRPQTQDGQTMIYVEPIIRTGWRRVAKRVVDVTMATTILIGTAPLLIASILAIKATSPGPAFFRQIRIGRDGVPFEMIKLRTMVVDAEARKAELAEQNEADGPLFKIAADPRITTVGRRLRKLSIDELPQLWNVLRGTMSMVGPRPALPNEIEAWDEAVRERLRVLPGLTGLWQVSGRSDSSYEQYKRMDLYYVDNWSLAHDLRICAATVTVVLTGRGAS